MCQLCTSEVFLNVLNNLDHPERLLQHEVPERPERVNAGGVLPGVGQPGGGKLGLVRRAHRLLGGAQLAVPVAHGVGLRIETLDVPGTVTR